MPSFVLKRKLHFYALFLGRIMIRLASSNTSSVNPWGTWLMGGRAHQGDCAMELPGLDTIKPMTQPHPLGFSSHILGYLSSPAAFFTSPSIAPQRASLGSVGTPGSYKGQLCSRFLVRDPVSQVGWQMGTRLEVRVWYFTVPIMWIRSWLATSSRQALHTSLLLSAKIHTTAYKIDNQQGPTE